MVFHDLQDCPRCNGGGVVKLKGMRTQLVCSCAAGKVLASWVPSRIEMWEREGARRG